MPENLQVVLTEEQIAARVAELAGDIRAAYEGQDLTVVGILEDSFVFVADLIRKINTPLACVFMKVDHKQTGGHAELVYTTPFDAHGRNVLLVGGILDTGLTMDYITRQFSARGAKTVKACVLVDKPNFRTTEFTPDFVGFTRTEEMIIGYGLGRQELYRYLPYMAIAVHE